MTEPSSHSNFISFLLFFSFFLPSLLPFFFLKKKLDRNHSQPNIGKENLSFLKMIHHRRATISKGNSNEQPQTAKPLIKIIPTPKQLASYVHVIICVILLYFWQCILVSYVFILVQKNLFCISNGQNQMRSFPEKCQQTELTSIALRTTWFLIRRIFLGFFVYFW